ncbi:MAG: ferritin-like domain-containing protein [Solimonas sp.]
MDVQVRRAWHAALVETEPRIKCERVAALRDGVGQTADDPRPVPGRPARPELIPPRDVPRRGLGTREGRAALAHAVAHIEFNAINLALDAGWRFSGMPDAYYADWLSVAQDEARHFQMLRARLRELGSDYGELPAHNGLWEAAEKTAHDPLQRMALVPRVLEARGLDVTPGMMRRLREVGDLQTVAVLEVILREEVRHVEIGTRWFRHLCAQRGLAPDATFRRLLAEHGVRLHPPFNVDARRAAGFADEEFLVGAEVAGEPAGA